MALKLFVDTVNRKLVSGLRNQADASVPHFVSGDKLDVELHFLAPAGRASQQYDYTTPPTLAKLGLGRLPSTLAALNTAWTLAAEKSISVTRLIAGSLTVKETQRVQSALYAYAGSFRLTLAGKVSGPIAYNATAAEFAAAINPLFGGNPTVTAGDGFWDVQWPTATAGAALMTGDATALICEKYLYGVLDLTPAAVSGLLGTASSVNNCALELQFGDGTSVQTVQRSGVTLVKDLIDSAPPAPPPGETYTTEAEVQSMIDAALAAFDASAIPVDSAAFSGNLSPADNTVQKALATIDQKDFEALSTANATNVDSSGFSGNLSTLDNTVQKALATIDQLELGTNGNDGWSPVLAVVADGARRVQRVVGWTGGEGTAPAVGLYVGPGGLVADIAAATDVRGAAGQNGENGGYNGWSPQFVTSADGQRVVLKLEAWTGGTGDAPAGAGKYVATTGLVDAIGDATDIRGLAGAVGAKGDQGDRGLPGPVARKYPYVLSASRAMSDADDFKYLYTTGSDPITLTINAGLAQDTHELELFQAGTGSLSIAAGPGVTIISKNGNLTLAGQGSAAALRRIGSTETYHLVGDLA